jgi:dCTP deaminase
MILSDQQILKHLDSGCIKIEPFRRECLGSNSYDVHLGNTLGVYVDDREEIFALGVERPKVLDAKEPPHLAFYHIPETGFVLSPGILYLGVTEEYTETHGCVPWLDGKSSVGRLGIRIHATAGRGDAGFMNHWTLEIDCVQPVRIYKGMPIGQLTYFTTGPIDTPYNNKAFAKYNQRSPLPVASAMHLNFDKETGLWK